MTLAPERNGMDAIARLAAAGVLVCAGHTASDYETVMEAIRHGLRGFTHLFNAMPPMAGRDPGPSAPRSTAGIPVRPHRRRASRERRPCASPLPPRAPSG